MLVLGFASFHTLAVDLRANDPLPPVPPGNSLPPPLPAASTPAPQPPQATQSIIPGAGTPAGGRRNHRLQKLKNELALTPQQIAQIRPIVQSTRQQIMALRQNTALPQQQKRQQIRQIQASTFQQIRPLLTPEQLQRWKQIREERRQGAKI